MGRGTEVVTTAPPRKRSVLLRARRFESYPLRQVMKREFCQVLISAPTEKEANKISDTLVKKKLVAGSLIYKGPCRFWWQGKTIEKDYYNVQCFSLMKNKSKIISEIERIHSEECPIIAFFKIDGNDKFLKWVKESVE